MLVKIGRVYTHIPIRAGNGDNLTWDEFVYTLLNEPMGWFLSFLLFGMFLIIVLIAIKDFTDN